MANNKISSLMILSFFVELMVAFLLASLAAARPLNPAPHAGNDVNSAFRAIIKGIKKEVAHALFLSEIVSRRSGVGRDKDAMSVCIARLRAAGDDLEAVSSGDLGRLTRAHSWEIRNSLEAAIAEKNSCLDSIANLTLKQEMQEALPTVDRLANDALSIVKNLEVDRGYSPRPNGDHGDWTSSRLPSSLEHLKPDVVVAKDGSGEFSTISAALDAMPRAFEVPYRIYVKAGIYEDQVLVQKGKADDVLIYGDGFDRTIVTGSLNARDGVHTIDTATFIVEGRRFTAMNMGFRNTAGPEKQQAVALRSTGDQAIFYNCSMEGYQDTLFVHSRRQYYKNCVISGTIDFIFGDSRAYIEDSRIVIRRPLPRQMNTVSAQGRALPESDTKIVINKCQIVADGDLYPDRRSVQSYLGRPWKPYSRIIISNSEIDDVIDPRGWKPWKDDSYHRQWLNTAYLGEYNNTGAGADTSGRVKWRGHHVLTDQEARQYTMDEVLFA